MVDTNSNVVPGAGTSPDGRAHAAASGTAPPPRAVREIVDGVDAASMRSAPSVKWRSFDDDVIPMWVADMDFAPAEEIRRAIREHVDAHPFVYVPAKGIPGLRESVARHQAERFGWQPEPEAISLLPNIVSGIFQSVRRLTSEGDGVVVPTPVYFPFLRAVRDQNRRLQAPPMRRDAKGYALDVDAIREAITPASRLMILCNPHNPTGRMFSRDELEAVAELALEHRLWVVSDELHADLGYPGREHVPFASLHEDVAARTVTLTGPTKAFNIAGLGGGYAIVEDPDLRKRTFGSTFGVLTPPNVLAQVAAKAAYEHDGAAAWLAGVRAHLESNRDRVAEVVATWPGVVHHPPEATYLAWLDLGASPAFADLGDDPAAALRERARVALTGGAPFGLGSEAFVRLNFATSRALLDEGLARLGSVLG